MISVDSEQKEHTSDFLIDNNNMTYWKASEGYEKSVITLRFPEKQKVSCVVLGEYLPLGQHIEQGEIYVDEEKIYEFTVVGHKRICKFDSVNAQSITVKITSSRTEPALRLLEVYR